MWQILIILEFCTTINSFCDVWKIVEAERIAFNEQDWKALRGMFAKDWEWYVAE
jgi:hypothetical protein